MIITFLKKAFLPQQMLILLFGFLLLLPSFIEGIPIHYNGHLSPLFSVLVYWLGDFSWLIHAFTILLIAGIGIGLNRLACHFELMTKTNHIPGFLFMVLTTYDLSFNSFSPGILASFFLLGSVFQLKKAVEEQQSLTHVFNASFLICIASMFYFPAIWFLGVAWLMLWGLRVLTVRSMFVSLTGIIVGYGYLAAYYFFTDNFQYYQREYLNYFKQLLDTTFFENIDAVATLFYAIPAIIALVGALSLGQRAGERTQIQRQGQAIFQVLFLASLFYLFLKGDTYFSLSIFALGVAPMAALFLSDFKLKTVSNIVLVFWLLLVLINNFNLVL